MVAEESWLFMEWAQGVRAQRFELENHSAWLTK